MSVSNPWLTPFQRSYNQIKSTLIERLKVQVPELTDLSEGNIFILLISLYAAIAEVLHYYIDNMARETFFVSARRYSSLVKHAKMVDYHIHAGIPSMVDITVSTSNSTPLTADISIPINTLFTDSSGNQWLSTKSVVWKEGTYGITIPLEQKQYVPEVNLGNTPGGRLIVQLPDMGTGSYYVEGSMNMKIGKVSWELVETFAYSGPYDRHYKVELDDDRKPYIQFGDGIHGKIPDSGLAMISSYYITKGLSGFAPAGTINTVPPTIAQSVNKATCTNIYDSVGGSNYENFDQLKARVPLHVRTLGVAITQQDYIDLVETIPGVDKAYVNYICGKFLEIYVTPINGGVAPSSLLNTVYTRLLSKKVITTSIKVLPVNVTEIIMSATITGRKSFIAVDISNQVNKALIENYGYNNSKIGKVVRLSDLYALMDNLSMVDHLVIDKIYLKPYPKKIGNTLTELNITYFNIDKAESKSSYIIKYMGNDKFTLSRYNYNFSTDIPLGSQATIDDTNSNNLFYLTLNAPTSGSYSVGNSWIISVIPPNQDQESDVVTLPIFKRDNISLTINEVV